ncbi:MULTISPECIES: hypothetical protein [unclassified Legionella]|uniref:hypothetical protein n=1 Tax=unclassified Legionella TaxID=2622702 RepID=UPI001E390E3A|nr:hypothetical protein [Legionella sp. 31fI33]MCC5015402.1 hypothetical protein [Legionella sp. 31fI33]
MGKPIQIQEIIAINNNGEILQSKAKELRGTAWYIKDTNSSTDDRVTRMAAHIENLAAQANTAHRKLEITTADVLVTRLSLNEFSLYTKETPLSLDEYKLLIKRIDGIASKLPANIHLLLATIPVYWPDNSVHNCALYVQSASSATERPIINHFAKKNYSAVDFHYINKAGDPLPLRGDEYGSNACPTIVLKDTEVRTMDPHQFESALKIITAEGESFITLIDICLDHKERVAEKNLVGLLAQLQRRGLKIPLYMSQLITSHTIAPIRKNIFASLTQADTTYKAVDRLFPNETRHLLSPFGDCTDLTLFPPTYLEMPYRKRVLRHLSATIPGQTILEETITHPRIALYLQKRIRSLAALGITMSEETQQRYQTWVDSFLFSISNLLNEPFIAGASAIASIDSPASTATEDSATQDLSNAEHWVEALLTELLDEPASMENSITPVTQDGTSTSSTEEDSTALEQSDAEHWVELLLTDLPDESAGIEDSTTVDLSNAEHWIDALLDESTSLNDSTASTTIDDPSASSTTDDSGSDFDDDRFWVNVRLTGSSVHPSSSSSPSPTTEILSSPDWQDSTITHDKPKDTEKSFPCSATRSSESLLYSDSNPYSLFFSGAAKEIEELKRPFKNHATTIETYPRFVTNQKAARNDVVKKRRHFRTMV